MFNRNSGQLKQAYHSVLFDPINVKRRFCASGLIFRVDTFHSLQNLTELEGYIAYACMLVIHRWGFPGLSNLVDAVRVGLASLQQRNLPPVGSRPWKPSVSEAQKRTYSQSAPHPLRLVYIFGEGGAGMGALGEWFLRQNGLFSLNMLEPKSLTWLHKDKWKVAWICTKISCGSWQLGVASAPMDIPFYEDDNRPKLPTCNITVFYTHQNITEWSTILLRCPEVLCLSWISPYLGTCGTFFADCLAPLRSYRHDAKTQNMFNKFISASIVHVL